jgi:signal transduction histidine kinase
LTRRILAALVGLTTLLLAGVVVPLGVFTVHHDRQVYLERAVAAAQGVANQAEERLADPPTGDNAATHAPLAAGPGDLISVVHPDGKALAALPAAVPMSAGERQKVVGGRTVTRWLDGPDRIVVIVPITSSGRVVGIAALSRPARPLDAEMVRLWLGLAVAGVAALLAATALALGLARWVNRPLRRLETVAVRLGEGALSARADTAAGPTELRELATTFNRMAGRLDNLLAGQRNVIADVSHQLRTPLAALRLRLELLREDTHGSTELEAALREVGRLAHLVDGLLAVARAENTTPSPRVIDAAAVTAERVEAWSPVASEGYVTLGLSSEPVDAWATPGHLEQILDNLIANAIEVTPAGGRIHVTASGAGDRVWIRVTDTGPGMTLVQRENALRRFWSEGPRRAEVAGDRQGSGLGLAIADRLATVDHGLLSLDDAPGGGLSATVELPAAKARRAFTPA